MVVPIFCVEMMAEMVANFDRDGSTSLLILLKTDLKDCCCLEMTFVTAVVGHWVVQAELLFRLLATTVNSSMAL